MAKTFNELTGIKKSTIVFLLNKAVQDASEIQEPENSTNKVWSKGHRALHGLPRTFSDLIMNSNYVSRYYQLEVLDEFSGGGIFSVRW